MWFLGCFISYLSETLLKVEKILTQASQGPLKVVQIHMPHPVGVWGGEMAEPLVAI